MNNQNKETVLSFRGWLSSFMKWMEILKKTENGEKFANLEGMFHAIGFVNLNVWDPCEYCHGNESKCDRCSLFINKEGNTSVCHGLAAENSILYQYVVAMRIQDNDKALRLARIVFKAIRQDGIRWGYYTPKE